MSDADSFITISAMSEKVAHMARLSTLTLSSSSFDSFSGVFKCPSPSEPNEGPAESPCKCE